MLNVFTGRAAIPLGIRLVGNKSKKSCWKCRKPIAEKVFCNQCSVIQPLKKDENYFDYFGLSRDFFVDNNDLKAKFLQLQTRVHPDKFTLRDPQEKKHADEHSSFANRAFKTLATPRSRASYLLKTDEQAASSTVEDQEFAMEMLELNEEIEELTGKAELEAKKRDVEENINGLMRHIETALKEGNQDAGRAALNRLRYFDRAKQLIDHKLGMPH